MVNTAPWQVLSEALLMATAPDRVKVAWSLAGTVKLPVWLVKLTPVAASQAAPLSLVMAPFAGDAGQLDRVVVRVGHGELHVAAAARVELGGRRGRSVDGGHGLGGPRLGVAVAGAGGGPGREGHAGGEDGAGEDGGHTELAGDVAHES
jgi:hypothetical protein